MKSILTAFALLACFAGPALAEEANTTTPPPGPSVVSAQPASPIIIIPAALPQSRPVVVVPMSTPAKGEALGPAGGGCHHDDTVYLTN